MGRGNNRLTLLNVPEQTWEVIEFLMDRLSVAGSQASEADIGRRLLILGVDAYKKSGRLGEFHLPWRNPLHGREPGAREKG